MQIEFAEELEPALTQAKTGLQVQGSFLPENDIIKAYLNRPYGNAYDFGQVDEVAGLF